MKQMYRTGVIALLAVTLLMAGLLAGCGGNNETQPPADNGNENGQEEPAEEMPGGFYEITGSDSEVNVVQALVEAFAGINDVAEFSVTGGGSGTGISDLINQTNDLAMSSRPMKDEEIDQAKANGVDPVAICFAFDGLAVIVHENNPVQELTIEQIGKIFAGEITNWSEVGGNNAPISLYGRQSTSGTYVFFRDNVVQGDYSPTMQNMPGTSQIVEGVRADETGIGYSAIGYVKGASGIKALDVATEEGAPYISPLNDEKVFAGEYALTRPLFQFVNGKPGGALKQFIEFQLSAAGQDIVVNEGFLPVTPEWVQKNAQVLN
jgi:phosphate transport system substrate-binding protein